MTLKCSVQYPMGKYLTRLGGYGGVSLLVSSLVLTEVFFSAPVFRIPRVIDDLQTFRKRKKKEIKEKLTQWNRFFKNIFNPNHYYISQQQSQVMHTNTWRQFPQDVTLKVGYDINCGKKDTVWWSNVFPSMWMFGWSVSLIIWAEISSSKY